RTAPVTVGHHPLGSGRCVVFNAHRLTLNPAPVNVDCAGPVREDVPSNSLLGEGLTGENNRLKRGLQRRTPAVPLRGLGSCGGIDLARSSERGCCAVSTAAIPPIGGSRVECPANKFDTLPFRSCELVDPL